MSWTCTARTTSHNFITRLTLTYSNINKALYTLAITFLRSIDSIISCAATTSTRIYGISNLTSNAGIVARQANKRRSTNSL